MTDESRLKIIQGLQQMIVNQRSALEIAAVDYVKSRTQTKQEWALSCLHTFQGMEKAVNQAIILVNAYYDK